MPPPLVAGGWCSGSHERVPRGMPDKCPRRDATFSLSSLFSPASQLVSPYSQPAKMPRRPIFLHYPSLLDNLSDDDEGEDIPFHELFPASGTSSKHGSVKMSSSSPIRAVTKRCYVCRAAMAPEVDFKSCAPCREKQRNKAREKAKEKRQARAELIRRIWAENDKHDASDESDEAETLEPALKKRKVLKSSRVNVAASRLNEWQTWPDVPLPARITAYVRARRDNEGSHVTIGLSKPLLSIGIPGVTLSGASWVQFQTRSAMHTAITSAVEEYYVTYRAHVQKRGAIAGAPSPIVFFGWYSIVADPSISHSARVSKEVGFLKVSSKLRHSSQ